MASNPITLWQIEGEKVKVVTDFIFLVSKITVDGDYKYEIKRRLFLRRKAMTNLDSIWKIRDIFADKGSYSQSFGFSSSYEHWTTKKSECQLTDAFELWCWRIHLRVPWTARRSINPKGNQPWIFIGKTDTEAPILWPPDAKNQLTGKDPDTGKDWRQE